MNTQPKAVQAQAYYGTPVSGQSLSSVAGARLAPPSGPYTGRDGKCRYGDDTCEGFAIKDSEFCVGHTKRAAKVKPAKGEVE